ncbi:methionyl-tRNA formyltransferase [bacterium]|nr:MAG: methionyl-tRNA formyltransferase [bacterium]
MRVVFMGNPDFSVPALQAIQESTHEIAGVVCSPDKPRGRGRKLASLPVKATAQEFGLRVFQPRSLKDAEFLKEMRSLQPEAFVVVAFRILPRELFSIPRFGSLNIHPSLLPRGRGPAPIQWTLLRGETETGITIIQLTEQIDGGGILMQERAAVNDEDCFGDLHDRFAKRGAELIVDVLDKLERGEVIRPIEQDESLATSARKLEPNDYLIDWSKSAEEIHHQIRAFSPTPGAATRLSGVAFKILKSLIIDTKTLKPRQLNGSKETLSVGTGNGDLRLIRVKPAGKKEMDAAAFLRGARDLPEFFDL